MSSNRKTDREETSNLIDITAVVDDVWKGLLRFWWFLLVVISVCASLVYAKTKLTYKPYYVASASYTVSTTTAYGYSNTYYNQTTASELGTTLQYILTSNVLQTMVAEKMGLDSVPGTISVSVMENTNLITISVQSSTAQNAYDVLQTVIETYPNVARSVIGDTVLEVMDETGLPMAPANPENAKKDAAKGAAAGVAIDIVFLLVYALTKRTIRKEDDFKKLLNVACIGVIPKARFKKRGKKGDSDRELVLMDNFRVPRGFVEAIRTVRTRFESDAKDHGRRVYLVTSAIPGEGKSTVASNIALSLALKGKKVALVDLDLRHPSLAPILDLHDYEYGSVDVLRGNVALNEALLRYKDTELMVLPGGTPVNRTSRILTQEYLDEMIEALKLTADYIILDTPPCAILSDATLVASHADGAIFVVRQDYARIDRVLEGIENLAETRIDICGCILNEAEVGVTGYGYGHHYGYGRYGYGYNSKKYGYGYGGYGYGEEKQSGPKAEDKEAD